MRVGQRVDRVEASVQRRWRRRWGAGLAQLRATMDPEHARLAARWLREHVDSRVQGPHVESERHVCPQCINQLDPPALARAVWFLLLEHTVGDGAPVTMPPNVARVYLKDPNAYPANPCEGCGYLLPTRSQMMADGTYRHIGVYRGECPVCGLSNREPLEESA